MADVGKRSSLGQITTMGDKVGLEATPLRKSSAPPRPTADAVTVQEGPKQSQGLAEMTRQMRASTITIGTDKGSSEKGKDKGLEDKDDQKKEDKDKHHSKDDKDKDKDKKIDEKRGSSDSLKSSPSSRHRDKDKHSSEKHHDKKDEDAKSEKSDHSDHKHRDKDKEKDKGRDKAKDKEKESKESEKSKTQKGDGSASDSSSSSDSSSGSSVRSSRSSRSSSRSDRKKKNSHLKLSHSSHHRKRSSSVTRIMIQRTVGEGKELSQSTESLPHGSSKHHTRLKSHSQSRIMVSAPPSQDVGATPQEPEPPKRTYRESVVHEIYATEQGYVKDLQIICNLILKPMRERAVIPETQIASMFSVVELLLGVNVELLKDLESGKNIGLSFLKMADYLKMYSVYCANQDQADSTVELNLKKGAFRAFLQEIYSNPELKGLKLRDYLIKPVQRLCKYPLLLRELIKHTESNHEDYEMLKKAMSKIEEVVGRVNDRKRSEEEQAHIVQLQSRLEGPEEQVRIVSPTRRLLREADLQEQSPGGGLQETHYLLFSDLLIRTKPSPITGKLVIKSYIPDDRLLVSNVAEQDGKFTFEIINAGTEKFVVVMDSEDERAMWLSHLENIVHKKLEASSTTTAQAKKPAISPQALFGALDADQIFNLGRQFTPEGATPSSPISVERKSGSLSPNGSFKRPVSSFMMQQSKRVASMRQSSVSRRSGKSVLDPLQSLGLQSKTKQMPPLPGQNTPKTVVFKCFYSDLRYVAMPAAAPSVLDLTARIRRKFAIDQATEIVVSWTKDDKSASTPLVSATDLQSAIKSNRLDLTISDVIR